MEKTGYTKAAHEEVTPVQRQATRKKGIILLLSVLPSFAEKQNNYARLSS